MGYIFSAFAWTYSVLQMPGGIAVDLVRVRVLYPFLLVAWSVATLVQGLVSSFAALIGCRMAIGVFEAPTYPCNNKIVTNWFPQQERASAIAVYTSGPVHWPGPADTRAGADPEPIRLARAVHRLGSGGIRVGGGLVCPVSGTTRAPERQPGRVWRTLRIRTRTATRAARRVGTMRPRPWPRPISWRSFRTGNCGGIYIGKFCLGGTLIFFLTWFPTYLVEYRGLGFVQSGFLASVPFLAAFLGVLISGVTSDYLVRRGVSNEFARKAPIVTGMVLTTCIVGANYTDNTFWVITFLSIAFFGNGLSSIAWVFVSLLSPRRLIGLVGGCFNFVSSLSAIVVPIVIGYLVDEGDFAPALVFIAALAIVGAYSFLFLVGEIKRIDLDGSLAAEQRLVATRG